jgi:hypothetical protein
MLFGAQRLFNSNAVAAAAGFTPLELSPWTWLDASSTSYMTLSGSEITSLNDRSGNGRNATNGTTGDRPIRSTGWQNGLSAAQFQGIVTSPNNGNVLDFTSPSISGKNTLSFFYVGQPNHAAGTSYRFGRILSAAPSSGNDYDSTSGIIYAPVGAVNSMDVYRNNAYSPVGTSFTNNTTHMFGFAGGGTTSANWLDGGDKTTASWSASNFAITRLRIGNDPNRVDSAFNGYVGEWILFDKKLTDGEVDKMFGYLAWKWGLTANLPVGHPYKSVAP